MNILTGIGIFFYIFLPLLVEIAGQFLVQGAAEFWFMSKYPGRPLVEINQYMAEITIIAALLLIPVLFLLYRRDKKRQEYMQWAKEKKDVTTKDVVHIVILSIAACILLNTVISLLQLQNFSDKYMETAQILYQPSVFVQLVGLGIIVPVMEEMVFRVLMYRRMKEKMNVWTAIILSAVIFGICHGNLVQFLFATNLGILLAYLYEKFKRPVVPIIGHSVVNITSVLMTAFAAWNRIFMSVVGILMIIVISCGIVILMLRQLKKDTV